MADGNQIGVLVEYLHYLDGAIFNALSDESNPRNREVFMSIISINPAELPTLASIQSQLDGMVQADHFGLGALSHWKFHHIAVAWSMPKYEKPPRCEAQALPILELHQKDADALPLVLGLMARRGWVGSFLAYYR